MACPRNLEEGRDGSETQTGLVGTTSLGHGPFPSLLPRVSTGAMPFFPFLFFFFLVLSVHPWGLPLPIALWTTILVGTHGA
jgi:hypothetical protein